MANFLQIDGAGEDYYCIHNQNGAKAQDMAMMVQNLNRCYEDHIFPKYNKFDEQGMQHLTALSDGLDARSVMENELLVVNRQKLRRISEIMNACRRIEGCENDGRSAGATQSYADGGESEFNPEQSIAEDLGGRGTYGLQNSAANEEGSRHGGFESEMPAAKDARDQQPQAKLLKSPTNMPDPGDDPVVAQESEKEPNANAHLENRSQGSAKSSDGREVTEAKRNVAAAESSNSKEIATDLLKDGAPKDLDKRGEISAVGGPAFTMDVSDADMMQAANIARNDEATQSEKLSNLFSEVGATTRLGQANRENILPGRDVPQPRNPAAASFNTDPAGTKAHGRGKNLPGYGRSRRSAR